MTAVPALGRPNRIGYVIGWALVPALTVVSWELLFVLIGKPAIASPRASVSTLVTKLGIWMPDLENTLMALGISFAIAMVLGVVLGSAIGSSSFWYEVLMPLVSSAYSVPKVVLYPLFLLVLGLTMQSRIAFAVMHGIFPIIIVCAEAAANIPAVYRKVGQSYRLGLFGRIRYIICPAILPSLVVALRLGFGSCFLGLILAEMFAAYRGLGFKLSGFMTLGQADQIFALVLLVTLIALLGTIFFLLIEGRQRSRGGARSTRM